MGRFETSGGNTRANRKLRFRLLAIKIRKKKEKNKKKIRIFFKRIWNVYVSKAILHLLLKSLEIILK